MHNSIKQKDIWKQEVISLIKNCLEHSKLKPIVRDLEQYITPGKMLRGLLPFYLLDNNSNNEQLFQRVAAAVELVHVASLLHDDIIDNSSIRRGAPAFWAEKGVAGAILLGDLLICKAYTLLTDGHTSLINTLIALTEEVCEAEVEQELIRKGTQPTFDESIQIARCKTGALFAFAAYACGYDDLSLQNSLKEAGYLIGTAYQLADDILDATGDSSTSDKPIGNDSAVGKMTLASNSQSSVDLIRLIQELYAQSQSLLEPWPDVLCRWNTYLESEFLPVIQLFTQNL